ncbi:MAG: 3-isopropylmalate dehydratase large subunit [Planctomycetes bacterium RIFCSPHIGHO2_02_FULL_50_42]|nr:MAG: 3-isopropylmalate dehydratase large subunit [Planctomycetes bacterium GWA2_50_13]OHB88012.1 MAG: 3-isopropylmalate dehydratase large subunit [Planctomycetes bacterium RIFCSPHIGHO2_02_FULL_50_42]OHB92041.1 MAG: 3-isopropylmalate dehydratase large subunit [Planctomycetes bacterium RIFCSPHIGHO2_12_FULL_51_37]OHB96173.1 MAG: 3-isopropylmalate dehydratase large subunit [Planctomycetes bacterium RIFCSPLOWO2_02_FULL_50_16]OHC04718.1 MAG: 3-isopropylmalate dehydratase large subunit [Planctomyce
MVMTLAEKIIAAHTDQAEVQAGQFVYAGVDFCLGNDITAPIAIKEFEDAGIERVFDRKRIALVPDHFTPNKDIASAEQVKMLRRFAERHRIEYFFEIGRMGIEHALLPEMGLVLPGDLVIGADSHTCTYGALGAFAVGVGSTDLAACFATGKVWLRVPETIRFMFDGKLPRWSSGKDIILHVIGDIGVDGALYKVMEFTGPTISSLPMDDRFAICNMAIEAGAKTGIIKTDDVTEDYVRGRAKRGYRPCHVNGSPDNIETRSYNASKISPQVAMPSLPSNVCPAEELSHIKIDQVVIGSCTNGRISDMRIAAQILQGRKVHPSVRLLIFPATQETYLQAVREGLMDVFIGAGAAVSTPTCGPCLGGHSGVLAEGERCLSTTNRNFPGRMGHPKSEVYLSSPAVAAASAVTGRITHPEELI